MILLLWPDRWELITKVMLMGRVVATSRQGRKAWRMKSWLL